MTVVDDQYTGNSFGAIGNTTAPAMQSGGCENGFMVRLRMAAYFVDIIKYVYNFLARIAIAENSI